MAVIEITTFRLDDGVDDADFLQADERVRTGFLYRQPGLVRATTARGEFGEWIAVVLWRSSEEADDAAALAETDPATAELRGLVDARSIERRRYTTLD
jgi:hypothetical protein